MAVREKKPVETWLNEVDYEFKGYMPEVEALKFVNFVKAVNDGSEENETPVVHLKMMDSVFNKERRCAILCHRGIGKALSLDSKVYTPGGYKLMGDIEVGDTVLNRYGNYTNVTHKSEVHNKPMYRVTLDDGRELKVCEDHNHIVNYRRQKREDGKRVNYIDEKVMTTKELLESGVTWDRVVAEKNPKGKEAKYWIPTAEAVKAPHANTELDYYTVGVLLGDGSIDKISGYSRLHSHIDDIEHFVSTIPYECISVKYDKRNPDTVRVGIYGIGKAVKKEIGTANVYSKSVPNLYKYNSKDVRLKVLQGLMDTDGTIDKKGNMSFTSVSVQLADDVVELVRSLGGVANKRYKKSTNSYTVYIRMDICPFLLPRKATRFKPNRPSKVAIVSIERIPDEPSQCITVADDTESFLTDGYTVTHNTTVFAEYLILFVAAFGYFPGFGKVNLMLYITDSIENGVKNLRRNVEYRYQESEFLKKMIPDQKIKVGTEGAGYVDLDKYEEQVAGGRKFTDIRLEFCNLNGHRTVVKGYGAKTGVRGAKEMGQRPGVAILDDLVSDEDARSDTVIETIENTVYKAVSKALHPQRQKMVWLGTPFNAKDPLYKAVESGAWVVSVYPICEKFPVSEEEFRGSWEDRFTYEYVKSEYEEAQALGKPENFNQELMLRIMSDEDRLISNNEIIMYDDSKVLRNMGAYNFYITTDFAMTEKKGADFSVISVWAYNNNGDWLLVDGICKKQLMDKNIDDLFRFVSMYRPMSVGIEVSGQQGGFISLIKRDMLDRNVFFNIASANNSSLEGIRPVSDKLSRFNQVLPMFKLKKIWFPESMEDTAYMNELMDELGNVSKKGFKSKHDDIADTISMLSEMNAFRPSEEVTYVRNSSGIWENFEQEDDEPRFNSTVF